MATQGTTGLTSLTADAPAILRRHPALLVEWLRLANLISRYRRERNHASVFVIGAMVVVAVVLVTSLSGHAAAFVESLAGYWVLVGVVAAVYAATTVSRRRRHIEESQSQSWLVATPISPSSQRLSHAIRTLIPLFGVLMAIVMFAVVVALLDDSAASAVGTFIAATVGGLFIGGAAGWWVAGRGKEQAGTVASRYVPHPRATGLPRPSMAALASWPIAQVLAWSRPENSRYVLLVALQAVNGGSSAIASLSIVAMYFIVSYLAALLAAMTSTSKRAATWLRATPMTLGTFVLSLSRRALVHQLLGTALMVVLMSMLGAPLGMAFDVAALWIGLVVSISGLALVDDYRGRSPAVKIALAGAAFAALAAAVHFRAGAKA